MLAKKSSDQERRWIISDPILLLRNEHTALFGQLWLLEHIEKTQEHLKEVLQALLRDSEVHFKREALLLLAIEEKSRTGK